jgi:hypothetical protein
MDLSQFSASSRLLHVTQQTTLQSQPLLFHMGKMNLLKSVSHLLLIVSMATALVPQQQQQQHCHHNHNHAVVGIDKTQLHKLQAISRRQVAFGLATVVGATVGIPNKANAVADNVPTKADLERIKLGHDQVVYLLNNFEKETTGESIL